jgi:hypothetical protein
MPLLRKASTALVVALSTPPPPWTTIINGGLSEKNGVRRATDRWQGSKDAIVPSTV